MLAVLLLPAACAVTRLERNAPGVADIATAPAPSAPRAVEPPGDPGGNMVVLSAGVFSGIGGAFGGSKEGGFSYGFGPEVSLAKGVTRSSNEDTFFPYPLLERGFGVNLGWTALTRSLSTGPLYLEGEYRDTFFTVALGWTVNPKESTHGPQATITVGPLYLRGTHELDLWSQVTVGLLFKGAHGWLWSQ
jgi:hypothetical protein